jgi:hypothetical protein
VIPASSIRITSVADLLDRDAEKVVGGIARRPASRWWMRPRHHTTSNHNMITAIEDITVRDISTARQRPGAAVATACHIGETAVRHRLGIGAEIRSRSQRARHLIRHSLRESAMAHRRLLRFRRQPS